MCWKIVVTEHKAKAFLGDEQLVISLSFDKFIEDHAHAMHVVISSLSYFFISI